MPRRVQVRKYGETDWYEFPINPVEFRNNDSSEVQIQRTITGNAVQQYAPRDGRVYSMIWKNLPNKSPYKDLIEEMEGWIRNGIYELKLRDLTGDTTDNTVQYVRFVNLYKELSPGTGPQSAEAHIKYDSIQLDYVLDSNLD